MRNTSNSQKSKTRKYHFPHPVLFTIPLDIYAESSKQRDKESYLKLQKLSKKCEELRNSLHFYVQQHTEQMQKVNSLLQRAMELNKRRFQPNRYEL